MGRTLFLVLRRLIIQEYLLKISASFSITVKDISLRGLLTAHRLMMLTEGCTALIRD